MAPSLNITDRLVLETLDLMVEMVREIIPVRIQLNSQLRMLEADVVRVLTQYDLDGLLSYPARSRRLERFLRELKRILSRRYSLMLRRLQRDLQGVPKLAQTGLSQRALNIFKVGVIKRPLAAIQLRHLADTDVVLGEPVEDWLKAQQERLRRRIVQELRMGLEQEETTTELVRRIRGDPTGRTIEIQLVKQKPRRIKEFGGGVFDSSRKYADILARTAAMSAFNKTLLEVFQRNASTIKGFQPLVLLDRTSSGLCQSRAAGGWFLDGKPLPEANLQETFPGSAPWHFQCHTTFVPVLKSWNALAKNTSLKKVPKNVRYLMDGQMATGLVRSIDDWIRLRGGTDVVEKLGTDRYRLWKKGRITLAQFIDTAGMPSNGRPAVQAR